LGVPGQLVRDLELPTALFEGLEKALAAEDSGDD
jgi:hypothetical protein